ncbi:protein FAM177A1 isoform X3 [Paramormyrops kingsleyae]|uniref:protein FAM177A1 isoform X3 n=1 Tax=Paramormyrops kingsleyae TaxID=1676925 RepID=UPI000CD66DD1|nr:protein FAM177B isoform X3 [Paramormyrops kingsleyae]
MGKMNEELQSSEGWLAKGMTGSIPSSPGQKRVIHFVSGETLEEESSDEEELFDEPVDTAQLSWRAYSRLLWGQFRRKSFRTIKT